MARAMQPFRTHQAQRGFTLIELMITLTIAAILLTMGVPSFNAMIKNNRLTAQTNQFVTAMNFARSEAIKRGASVTVTATDDSDGDNEWGPGWSITDNGGNTLRVFTALDAATALDSTNNVDAFVFQSSGRVDNADTLTMCDDREGETGRQITIAATGRVGSSTAPCL